MASLTVNAIVEDLKAGKSARGSSKDVGEAEKIFEAFKQQQPTPPKLNRKQRAADLSVVNSGSASIADRQAALFSLKQADPNSPEVKRAEAALGMAADVESGTQLGAKLIGNIGRADTKLGRVDEKLGRVDESLGRVKEDQYSTEQSADTQDILRRRREALSGVDSAAAMADRAKASEAFGSSEETTRRRLAGIQANTGVRGDTAATQQAGALYQGLQARAGYERDLVIANTQLRAQALSSYEQSVQSAESAQNQARFQNIALSQYNLGQQLQERNLQNINLGQEQQERNLRNINLGQQLKERELEQFNLQQAARERFGAIGVGFGMASLSSAATSADKQAAASAAASAAKSSGGK